jgi:signal transduction histidine kinase
VTITKEADWAVLTIQDDGVGFDDAVVERAFHAFEQGDATRAMSSPGAGLGLTYVQEIVALHGGTVDVSNAPTGGARIVVRLPRVTE